MGRKTKYNAEEKIYAVREYLDGKESMSSIAKRLNIAFQSFKQWVKNYEAMGPDAFATKQNKHYSKLVKEQAVNTPFSKWGEIFGSPTLANAVLDRLLHHSSVVSIKGPSYV